METNKIYQEPCLETLRKMPDSYLDCVVTSPPYWQLRDYGYPEQWGLEPTFQEYLEHLWEMMDEIYRVLKPEGTVWINLGDTYGTQSGGLRGKTTYDPKNKNATINVIEQPKTIHKCLLLLPHRFAIGCIERGWIMRNDIIWAKRNAMPESVTDRFSKKHEYFFFMVKSPKYYFDLDSVRDKIKPESLVRYKYDFSGNKGDIDRDRVGYPKIKGTKSQYSVVEKDFRNPVVEVRDLPDHDKLRKYLADARKKANITIQEIEDKFGTQAPHHWFEKNGSYPSKEDWIKLKEILNFDDKYDQALTEVELKSGLKENNPKGKNCGDVADFWDILTKPSSSSHYATYNDELIMKPILAGCPKGGIIYDPFMGTGSTAEACLRSDRLFIGSEMSEDYCKIANQRLQPFLLQTKLF